MRSVPPYRRGGTASYRGAIWAMRMPGPPQRRPGPPADGLRAWRYRINTSTFIVLLLVAVAGGKPRATPAAGRPRATQGDARPAPSVGPEDTRGTVEAVFPRPAVGAAAAGNLGTAAALSSPAARARPRRAGAGLSRCSARPGIRR